MLPKTSSSSIPPSPNNVHIEVTRVALEPTNETTKATKELKIVTRSVGNAQVNQDQAMEDAMKESDEVVSKIPEIENIHAKMEKRKI